MENSSMGHPQKYENTGIRFHYALFLDSAPPASRTLSDPCSIHLGSFDFDVAQYLSKNKTQNRMKYEKYIKSPIFQLAGSTRQVRRAACFQVSPSIGTAWFCSYAIHK